mgnify:CR=1 FL=1
MYMKFLVFFVMVIAATAAGLASRQRKSLKSMLAKSRAEVTKFGRTAEHATEERRLGVKGNGVSYFVHKMFNSHNNASATCDPMYAGEPMIGAMALSKDSSCENDSSDSGSSRIVGCSGDHLMVDSYSKEDCMGDMHSFEFPIGSGCEMSEGDYTQRSCRAKYPFKNQGGVLHT